MNFNKYMELCKVTESDPKPITNPNTLRQLHAIIGMSTESNELLDQIKKHVFYGKPLNYENLFEETGDVMWYLAILCDASGFDFHQILKSNIAKLQARYGEKFSLAATINRNTEKEMIALAYDDTTQKKNKKKKEG